MDDLIYRDKLLAAYDAAHKGPPGGARRLIAEAPAVDAVPVRHGRWKGLVYDGDIVDSLVFHIWMCSECGQRHFGYKNTLTNFCPNCGADMRKGSETE